MPTRAQDLERAVGNASVRQVNTDTQSGRQVNNQAQSSGGMGKELS